MARNGGHAIDAAGIAYGPPLPPARTRRKRRWGEGYIFRGEIGKRDYVVVEEVIDDNVVIVVAPWPFVDPDGGLVFAGEEERRQAVVDRVSFQRRLARRQVVAYEVSGRGLPALRVREIAAGDVFAIATKLPEGEVNLRDYGDRWIRGTVIDVTAMARHAAKAAMLAALTGAPLSSAEVVDISESAPEPKPPTTPRRRR